MKAKDLIIEILTKIDVSIDQEVCIDGSHPFPLEEKYDIIQDKGFLLFREKTEKGIKE